LAFCSPLGLRLPAAYRFQTQFSKLLNWFGLREHTPPALIVWGINDGYMTEPSARAYLRDLPDAELHLFDGGHWLLETHLHEVVPLVRDFLERVYRG
jgi:pimeloyl-ACP methyl ester carboxylesterase